MEWLQKNPDMIYVVYTGVALGVFLLFTGITQLLSRREYTYEAKSRRMKMIASGRSTEEILALLKPPSERGFLSSIPFLAKLPSDLIQIGAPFGVRTLILICVMLGVVLAAAMYVLFGRIDIMPAGVVVGLLVPLLLVKKASHDKTEELIKQLPDALDLMARGLRVGHPLNTSIGAVAEEMPDPIGTHFGIIFDQVSFGDDLPDAFAEFAERVDIEDVHYLSASIGIQHGTGGDLASIVQVLSQVIRNRIAMRRRIQAISAEGRLTGYFLSALPIFIFLSTNLTNPDYYWGVMDQPQFVPMAIIVVGLIVANALILRSLVNFKI